MRVQGTWPVSFCAQGGRADGVSRTDLTSALTMLLHTVPQRERSATSSGIGCFAHKRIPQAGLSPFLTWTDGETGAQRA